MIKKIQKWGNSLAVRIPNEYIITFDWKAGSKVDIKRSGKNIIITSSQPKYSLEEMIDNMTKKYVK